MPIIVYKKRPKDKGLDTLGKNTHTTIMTPLESILRQQIAATGPVTVEEYMELCLYHPEHGYYTNGYNFLPVANAGTPYPHDFTTAPELTPLFGATLANWAARQWETIGSPALFILMECGPGRGALMHALLIHLQAVHPACYAAAVPTLIEVSPALTHLQQQTLAAFSQTQWHLSPVAYSQSPIILIANELLDAFPHSQLIEHEGRIQPRTIEVNATGEFAFTQSGPNITEHSPQIRTWLQSLPQTVQAACFLDYGASVTGPTGDTFQAVHRHTKVSVFHLPGQTDLTMHVNFHNVTQALSESHPHLQAAPLEALTAFLLNHGLASLALAGGPHPETDTVLHRLLHPTQMGTLFKVQCYTHITR